MTLQSKANCKSGTISGQSNSKIEIISNALFVETVKANYQMYLGKCYAYVKCPSLAEDAVQEGILAAHLNLESVKNRTSFAAWLYRIVIRKAIDLLHKKNKLVLIDDELENLVSYNKYGILDAPIWAEIPDLEEDIIKNEGLEKIKKAVETLDDIYRIPLLLKDFEGFSIRETAKFLNISEANTKVRIHRARIKLKVELNSYFFPEYMESIK